MPGIMDINFEGRTILDNDSVKAISCDERQETMEGGKKEVVSDWDTGMNSKIEFDSSDAARILKECLILTRGDQEYEDAKNSAADTGEAPRSYHLMVWLEHFLRSSEDIFHIDLDRPVSVADGDPSRIGHIRRDIEALFETGGELVEQFRKLDSSIKTASVNTNAFHEAVDDTLEMLDEASEHGFYTHLFACVQRLRYGEQWPLLDPD